MQKLSMPFRRQMMLCGYKNARYRSHWGYPHYGVDISTIQGGAGDDPTVYAGGSGTVLAAGRDNSLGYGLAVLYPEVYNHKTGRVQSLVARYMHLRSISVKAGQKVTRGEKLGVEGKEGTGDYHLHLEFDSDVTLGYAVWSPQVSSGHTFWKKGLDSTVNPSHVLHIGEGQTVVEPTYNPAWLNPEDLTLPKLLEEGQEDAGEIARLKEQLAEERKAREAAQTELDDIRAAIRRLAEKYAGQEGKRL